MMPVLLVLTCITSHILCSASQLPPNQPSYNPHQPTRNLPPQTPQQHQTQNLPPYSPHSPHAPPHQSPPQYNPPPQSQPQYNPLPPAQSPPQYNPPAQSPPQYNPPPPNPLQYNQPPQQAQGYCDPKTAPKCSTETDLPYCINDAEYPAYDIANKISQDSLFLKKYADKANQSADDLIEGITKETEESFNYSFYTGASKGDSPYDSTNWIGPEGSLCPSETAYVKITRAVNVEGFWRIILQHIPEGYGHGHYNYTQTTRLETCLFPSSSCRLLAPCYQSSCTQQYVYHRMLSVDPCDSYRGFFVDTFKLPSACSCSLP
eukprot:TRINITY_DN23931_c0_g1_i1.p1 TRINITY_DN23931_c0_g1~~TRINITY_DN23931_c0_g1_i1.p1  ORF type:complete len:318 (+),score=56.14 TRINITY_DN23931_c0_g1_i1:32-985(+)